MLVVAAVMFTIFAFNNLNCLLFILNWRPFVVWRIWFVFEEERINQWYLFSITCTDSTCSCRGFSEVYKLLDMKSQHNEGCRQLRLKLPGLLAHRFVKVGKINSNQCRNYMFNYDVIVLDIQCVVKKIHIKMNNMSKPSVGTIRTFCIGGVFACLHFEQVYSDWIHTVHKHP